MEEGGQRVVVVMDASRDVSPSTINGILKGLSLKPGDALKFLGVLHQVNKPTTLSFMGAGKICKNSCLISWTLNCILISC